MIDPAAVVIVALGMFIGGLVARPIVDRYRAYFRIRRQIRDAPETEPVRHIPF